MAELQYDAPLFVGLYDSVRGHFDTLSAEISAESDWHATPSRTFCSTA